MQAVSKCSFRLQKLLEISSLVAVPAVGRSSEGDYWVSEKKHLNANLCIGDLNVNIRGEPGLLGGGG